MLLIAYSGVNQLSAADARGIVFEDLNQNGLRDPGERGLPAVPVSNQREVVLTDSEGNWSLPYNEDAIFFVIKPSGWATPLDANNLPQFYYVHKPAGSPKHFKYRGEFPAMSIN